MIHSIDLNRLNSNPILILSLHFKAVRTLVVIRTVKHTSLVWVYCTTVSNLGSTQSSDRKRKGERKGERKRERKKEGEKERTDIWYERRKLETLAIPCLAVSPSVRSQLVIKEEGIHGYTLRKRRASGGDTHTKIESHRQKK